MPQLQINQGPQDALLYDNSRSYFTNVGYSRTSNFQIELRDVDPQNTAQLGSTVQFVIPKAADLLGPVDLLVKFNKAASTAGVADQVKAWVETVGYAMIEKVTFSIGSHDIESITGEQLNIINELMKSDEMRLGRDTIMKTGRPAVSCYVGGNGSTSVQAAEIEKNGRVISKGETEQDGAQLIVPLGLFFTKHPGSYFPLAAIAGCNDVRIAIKFRPLADLLVKRNTNWGVTGGVIDDTAKGTITDPTFVGNAALAGSETKLRCHYVHVTGPEATTLMNKEHVRLLKLWATSPHQFKSKDSGSSGAVQNQTWSIDLSFLHPVQELIITIRKSSELTSALTDQKPSAQDQGAGARNYFAYHGSGDDPNVDSLINNVYGSEAQTKFGYSTVLLKNIKLTLNGQERYPSLASKGIDRNYLMNRLTPMLHSNCSVTHLNGRDKNISDTLHVNQQEHHADQKYLAQMLDRKEIYVYPFALNPEGLNPSGAVNFSKVSHAKLELEVDTAQFSSATADLAGVDYQGDVYGVHYNWLQIKDGRALTSFA